MRTHKKNILLVALFLFSGLIYASTKRKADIQGAFIRVEYDKPQSLDTITLTIWEQVTSEIKKEFTISRQYKTVINNTFFEFNVDSLSETVYFTLGRGNIKGQPVPMLKLYLCSPGDSVVVNVKDLRTMDKILRTYWGNELCSQCEEYSFSGVGAEKYTCQRELEKLEQTLYEKLQYIESLDNGGTDKRSIIEKFEKRYQRFDYLLRGQIEMLVSYRNQLSSNVYTLIKADLVGQRYGELFRTLLLDLRNFEKKIPFDEKEKYRMIYSNKMKAESNDEKVPLESMVRSAKYPTMLIYRSRVENILFYNQNQYERIKQEFDGLLQERIITNYLLDNSNISNADSIITDAISIVMHEPFRGVLVQLMESQRVGTIAHNFALSDRKGNIVRLSDFLGKVVFIDFWFTGCQGCAHYYKTIVKEAKNAFRQNPNVVFVSISIDSDRDLWIKGLNSGQFTSDDAVNLYTGDLGIRHPIIKQFYVQSYPHPLLIGSDGKVVTNDENELRKKGSEGLIDTISTALEGI